MWSWNQFRNLPKNQTLSTAEQSRQYFIHQSNMMYEASINTNVSTAVAAASSGGGSKKIYELALTFDDINNVTNFSNFSGDSSNLEDWNLFFVLPEYGTPFTSLEVNGNKVTLKGGSNIIMRESLFDGSDSLLEVDDTGCVIELEYNVFGDDNNTGSYELVSVNFPNVKTAGDYCFTGCDSLTGISLPTLTILGEGSFYNCTSLTSINIPLCTNLGGSLANDDVFYGIEGSTIEMTLNELVLNDEDIFSLGLLNTLIINGVGYQPFTGYTGDLSLTFVNITDSDILVGDSSNVLDWNIFFGLPSWSTEFSSVSVDGNEITLIGGENILLVYNIFDTQPLVSFIDQGCVCYASGQSFYTCQQLVSVSLPQLLSAGDNCFAYCSSLTSVNLPLLTTAGDFCFVQCMTLITISLPQLTIAGYTCFYNCISLEGVSLPQLTIAGDYCFYNCTSLITISLPLLTTAGDNFFTNCTSLESVNLPQLTTTGYQSFLNCSSLIAISLPLLTNAISESFLNCSSLTTINLPKIITAGDYCFYNCISLEGVSLPQLTIAGINCFTTCSSLETVSLPKLTNLRSATFFGCSLLTSVSLPEITTVENNSFTGCSSLTTISLPKADNIGNSSFFNCSSLTTINLPVCVTLGATTKDNNVFIGITGKTISLTIPAALMTCATGNPDGDIQYLQANNTVTITQV